MKNKEFDVMLKTNYADHATYYNISRFGSKKNLISKEIKNLIIIKILKKRNLISEGTKIIDIATGTGRIAHELVKWNFAHVDSVDLTPEMLEISRQNVDPKYQNKLSWEVADMKKLPFPDQSFDVATMGSFLYLIPLHEYGNYTMDVFRILKPGGILVCEVSNALCLLNFINFISIMYQKIWKKKEIKSYIYPWNICKVFKKYIFDEIFGVDYPLLLTNIDFYKKMTFFLGNFVLTKYFGGKFVIVLKKGND